MDNEAFTFNNMAPDVYLSIGKYLSCCDLTALAQVNTKYRRIFRPFIKTQLIYVLKQIIIMYFKEYHYINDLEFIHAFKNLALSDIYPVLDRLNKSSYIFDVKSLTNHCRNIISLQYGFYFSSRYVINSYLYLLGKSTIKSAGIYTYSDDNLKMIYNLS